MDLAAAALVTPGELVFTAGRVATLAEDAPYQWISHLQRPAGAIEAAEKDMDEFLAALLCSPALEVPAELRYEEVTIQPRPSLRIRAADPSVHGARKLRTELSFELFGHTPGVDWPEKRRRILFQHRLQLVLQLCAAYSRIGLLVRLKSLVEVWCMGLEHAGG